MATIVISHVPPCTEQDVLRALMPYGAVHSVSLVPAQRQAIARFQNAAEANALLRHGAVFIGQTNCPVMMANQQSTLNQVAMPGYNHVKVTVTNVKYAITQQVLMEVCSRIGAAPESVYVYPSAPGDPAVVALVKFPDPSGARTAVEKLNKANIYPDCCSMTVEYAVVEAPPVAIQLPPQVQAPPPPPQVLPPPNAVYATYAPQMPVQQIIAAYPHNPPPAMYVAPPQPYNYANGASMYPPPQPNYGPPPFALRGGRGRVMPPIQPGFQHMRGGIPAFGRGRGFDGGRGREVFGRGRGVDHLSARGGYGGHAGYEGDAFLPAIVLITNVPTDVPLFNLFALLEVYGNVLGMKRQYSSPTNVVVRFQNHIDAKGVAFYLNQAPFFGSTISAKLFGGYHDRFPFRSDPGASPTDPTVKEFDFTAYHHRSSPMAPANASRKFCPSENVFVTNLKAEITDSMLQEALAAKGHSPVDIIRKGPNSAIVAFPTAGIAVEMIVACHTFLLEGRYLKLMFSGLSPEQTRTLPPRKDAVGSPEENDDEPPGEQPPVPSDGAVIWQSAQSSTASVAAE